MRVNLPVIDREYEFPDHEMIVSMTDIEGNITHCNGAFIRASGFSYDELIGQPHNMIRHPDMPAEGFRDLWHTVEQGKPWTGVVKNRRKDGSYYWVHANVTPIMENGRPKGYMSVRTKPTRAQVQACEALYAHMRAEATSNNIRITLDGGRVLFGGVKNLLDSATHLPVSAKLGLWMVLSTALVLAPHALGMSGVSLLLTQLLLLTVTWGAALLWLATRVLGATRIALDFARDISGCNLATQVEGNFSEPIQSLMQSLRQIQVNLRAVVGDVQTEIRNFSQAATEISSSSIALSDRTESQASSLEQTAASMEQISSTVEQTSQTAEQVSVHSRKTTQVVAQGEESVRQVSQSMIAIDHSANKMRDIIAVIEGIAFQTNILALNAAVEAARAGEQGRGFAVVAAEVRALAQRSAVAAKEIRELIVQSANQISDSSSQMQKTKETIDGTVQAVRHVGELIQEITNASREQSLGIQQVNQAVMMLDGVTQQNAAMAEESAASAEALRSSVVSLGRSIDVFHMP